MIRIDSSDSAVGIYILLGLRLLRSSRVGSPAGIEGLRSVCGSRDGYLGVPESEGGGSVLDEETGVGSEVSGEGKVFRSSNSTVSSKSANSESFSTSTVVVSGSCSLANSSKLRALASELIVRIFDETLVSPSHLKVFPLFDVDLLVEARDEAASCREVEAKEEEEERPGRACTSSQQAGQEVPRVVSCLADFFVLENDLIILSEIPVSRDGHKFPE